jgi:type I site-specific restriction-modification system R (restriction) subunit
VWQTTGTGLTLSVVSYIVRAKLLPWLKNKHVIVLADRANIAMQFYQRLSDLTSREKTIKASLPASKTELARSLRSDAPKVIVSTIQKFDLDEVTFDKECLVIGYNLHGHPQKLPLLFHNAVYILFTNIPPQYDAQSSLFFGDLVGNYSFRQAINDGVALPLRIENRRIETHPA